MKHWIVIFCTLLFLAGCGDKQQTQQLKETKVKAASLKENASKGNVYFPAVANAATKAELSFRVAGEVVKVNVRGGDKVKKGEVLALLDPTDYKLDVDNASARYKVINNQYQRSKPLVKKGLLAQSQFDELAAERGIALADLQLAKLRLSFTKLLAPYDGIISVVDVEKFENIQLGQQIINIQNLSNLDVLVQIPDRLYTNRPTLEKLAQFKAFVRTPSGQEYPVSIKEFTTEPNPTTETFTVTFDMPMPKDEIILDGMAVQIRAAKENSNINLNTRVLVPIEAIFNADGDALERNAKYVWVINQDNTVSKQLIKVGKATNNHIQVLEGLTPENRVVIAGITKLREGMKVQVVSGRDNNE
ncbi:efflux RND transporter periplasmic adaptor subunit [Vibrio marisflavi]|uniref:Solvent efflux pump periplasmic linker SrpA n=1 Tax=Vibrio marisflavi CECT 7928 TaxID=634439 RepID=A0ABN8E4Y2_9VIBR|nr:efflux RND transporter periplasmic adaptor subunit [Vibrio marisflavi]CAH0539628.1 Solvent efflux pump periplasmic linker SrpA [Vibrio marisflavi CECT 7928]